MADRVKESGSWAQSEVIQTLQDNGVLPSHANEAIALADVIGSTAKSYAENAELVEELKGKKQLTFKIFKNGVFAPVSVLVDYSNGSNVEKAIAKAIASELKVKPCPKIPNTTTHKSDRVLFQLQRQ